MGRNESTVTQKGQVTIPRDVRNRLGLRPHDRVVFELEGEVVRLRRAESRALAGYGSVTPRKRPEDFIAIREEFERGVAEEVTGEG